jgi:hypothetical protein
MSLNTKAQYINSVTPSDTVDLPGGLTAGLYVGTSGNVNLMDTSGVAIVLHNLVAGVIHPIVCRRVLSTGTTAVNIRACY